MLNIKSNCTLFVPFISKLTLAQTLDKKISFLGYFYEKRGKRSLRFSTKQQSNKRMQNRGVKNVGYGDLRLSVAAPELPEA